MKWRVTKNRTLENGAFPAFFHSQMAVGTTAANQAAIVRALEAAGVEFIPENGGGAGVRLRKGEPS